MKLAGRNHSLWQKATCLATEYAMEIAKAHGLSAGSKEAATTAAAKVKLKYEKALKKISFCRLALFSSPMSTEQN